MFRYSVWYKVKDLHPINQAMQSYASLLDTPRFPAHVTIASQLSKEKALDVYRRYTHASKPMLSASGNPVQTMQAFDRKEFHAVEQRLNMNGVVVDGIHLSLAYRLNQTFTPMEMAHAPALPRIYPEDIEVCVANCHAEDPGNWFVETL